MPIYKRNLSAPKVRIEKSIQIIQIIDAMNSTPTARVEKSIQIIELIHVMRSTSLFVPCFTKKSVVPLASLRVWVNLTSVKWSFKINILSTSPASRQGYLVSFVIKMKALKESYSISIRCQSHEPQGSSYGNHLRFFCFPDSNWWRENVEDVLNKSHKIPPMPNLTGLPREDPSTFHSHPTGGALHCACFLKPVVPNHILLHQLE